MPGPAVPAQESRASNVITAGEAAGCGAIATRKRASRKPKTAWPAKASEFSSRQDVAEQNWLSGWSRRRIRAAATSNQGPVRHSGVHFRIAAHVLSCTWVNVLAVMVPRLCVRVLMIQSTIQATSVLLPMPCPLETAIRIG